MELWLGKVLTILLIRPNLEKLSISFKNLKLSTEVGFCALTDSRYGWEVILVSVLETGLPGIAVTAGSDRHFSIYCPNSD